jgi:DNA-binding response OmpR family regulator
MNPNPNPIIFIAEDEETLSEIYSERFRRAGFDVRHFKNGLELLGGLTLETPDAILLDIMMPEMNGHEVLASIHKNFSDKDKQGVPVIAWSNTGNDAEIKKALEAGATEYLQKIDYKGDDLVERVKEIMAKKSQTQS